ncbi:MAG: manganese efflux pump, partial [Clostridia bacterium]|nr:manganese efflux pump [Clostridia bacterium]
MLIDGIKNKEEEESKRVGVWGLLVQGVATSIDALSVGFEIGKYDIWEALVSVSIIGVITFVICLAGINIGKKFGTHLAGKAAILGGVILIVIGIEIFITGIFDIELLDIGRLFNIN